MPQQPKPFIPESLDDVFAIFLARELSDSVRVRFYAGLTRTNSPALLLKALRRARETSGESPTPSDFLAALREVTGKEGAV